MRKTIISLIATLGCMSSLVSADELKVQENAPDRYVVVKGDTLWDISGRFLKQPWRWPEIWNLNKEQIKDPHWIYPGDVIVLDRSGDKPQLKLLKNEALSSQSGGTLRGEQRLSPQVRSSALGLNDAISSIPPYAVEPYLKRPIIIEPEEFSKAPRIAAGPDERVVFSAMDRVYAVGLDAKPGEVWYVYRQGKALLDPDETQEKKLLGYEAHYIGDVRVDVSGQVATLQVLRASEEIGLGDRLVKATEAGLVNFSPRLPSKSVSGQVVAAYGGVADAGTYTTVIVNRGSAQGLDVGNVLFAYKKGLAIKKERREEADLRIPAIKSANLFVYRVFPAVSYALVLDSTLPVNRGDVVQADPQAPVSR